jgi:hypothetical protein
MHIYVALFTILAGWLHSRKRINKVVVKVNSNAEAKIHATSDTAQFLQVV